MPCIFCRSNFHTKSNCVNPSTREKENSIMSCIQRTYTASHQLHLTYDEFAESMNIILNRLYKVIEIKIAIEYIKKRTGQRYNNTTTRYTVHKSNKQCNDSTDCPVCFNRINDNTYVYFQCFHEFCKNCVKECLSKNILNCPLCRDPITKIYTQITCNFIDAFQAQGSTRRGMLI